MKRKMKRFSGEEGSQVFSEAQEKWLGGADRTDPYILARMRSAVPDEAKKDVPAPKSTAPSDNFYGTSSEKEIADASFKTPSTEKPKVAPPKRIVRQAAPRPVATKTETKPVVKEEVKTESREKEGPKLNGKTFSETILDKKSSKLNVNGPKLLSDYNAEAAKKPPKEPEPEESLGRRIRKALGSKYKSGGEVKRTSASKRGDGIATKGHTRGRYV